MITINKTILPFDKDAESSLICTLVQSPHFYYYNENLRYYFFYDKTNAAIYWAIENLLQEGIENIDDINVITKIRSNKRIIDAIGLFNEDDIKDIIDMSELMARNSKEEYLNISNRIIELSFRRKLYKKMKHFESQCLNTKDNLNDLHTNIVKQLDDLAMNHVSNNEIVMFKDKVDLLWGEILEGRNDNGTYGILSKYPILEKYFTYQDGELILLSARRKHGKSVFGMNELVHKLDAGIPCVYFDTEMKDKLYLSRLLAYKSGVEEYKIKSGKMNLDEVNAVEEAKKWYKSVPFYREYDPMWTRDKVLTKLKVLKNKMNFKFFVYDYIKITDNSTTSSSEQYNELGNWCNFLKNEVAGRFDIPVLSFAQLNRQMNIADSDKIERYVTTGLRWMPKTEEEILNDGRECGNYKLTVDFNRIGDSTDDGEYLDFFFRKGVLRIDQCKQHEKILPEMMVDD